MDAKPPPQTPDDDADLRLRRALLDLPADAAGSRLAALNQRVLVQWQAAQDAAAGGAGRSGRPWLALWGRGGRASWVAGAAGLTAGLALVLHAWLRAPDPALDELLQPDVLSQMAAGEM
jgi:hypothetical protein